MCVKQGGGGEREGGVCISSMCVCELCAYTHTLNVCVHMRNIIIPPVILLQSNYNLRSFSTHTAQQNRVEYVREATHPVAIAPLLVN